jgi:GNAT superfamily N-acetyltransferase
MDEYAHDDPKLAEFSEALEPYVKGHNARGIPYQVFVHNEKLVGYVVVAEEPIRLIEPIGTPMSFIVVIDYSTPIEVLQEFAEAALRIAQNKGVAYSFIDIPAENEKLIAHFLTIGYSEIAHSLRMSLDLASYEGEPSSLKIDKVKREEVGEFIEKIMLFMSGSHDNMVDIVFSNIKGLPEEFVDYWYNSTSLNYVYDDDELVAVLDLSPDGLNIANIGVSPDHRGKGYGRKIMHYAFATLKKRGDKHARLRVHAENQKAIGLYESVGMEQGRSFKALIWRK